MKSRLFLFLLFFCAFVYGQRDSIRAKPVYNRKEEIIHDNKRYRVHNNYLTLGGGFLGSSIREDMQLSVNADFQFHIRRQHFQFGGMMSGQKFLSNNNTQVHLGYGIRQEGITRNLAAFAGPTYFTGVTGYAGQQPEYYDGWGFYLCGQAAYKFAYDIGVGLELFFETSQKQTLGGLKFFAFFSGAYRGIKKRGPVNPNTQRSR